MGLEAEFGVGEVLEVSEDGLELVRGGITEEVEGEVEVLDWSPAVEIGVGLLGFILEVGDGLDDSLGEGDSDKVAGGAHVGFLFGIMNERWGAWGYSVLG